MKKKIIFYSLLVLVFNLTAQSKIDSLLSILRIAKNDTNKVNTLNALAWEYQFNNLDSSLINASLAIILSEKINFKMGKASALRIKGIIYGIQAKYQEALHCYFESIKQLDSILIQNTALGGNHKEKIEAESEIAKVYGNIGLVYMYQADYSRALEYYFKALKIDELINNKKGIARHIGNIGIIYKQQGNFIKALDFYFKSLKIKEELNDEIGIALTLGNIGNIYANQKNYSSALFYYLKTLRMHEYLGNNIGTATVLGNIGNIYISQSDYTNALKYLFKALKIDEEIGNKKGIALHLSNIGELYLKTKKIKEADKYLKQSLLLYNEIGDIGGIRDLEKSYSEIEMARKNYKAAFEHFKNYIAARDSINSDENTKRQTRTEIQYEFDKREALANAEQEKKDAIAKEELEKQTLQRNGFIGGFLLMLALTGVAYRSYRSKQKANLIITQQKHLVEEKHKEITDSINYAERIQRSFLATREMLDENLRDYFVFFKPKDVVSGDFYWAAQLQNNSFAFTVADSTGHGVPGAIMSILNISSLEKSIETQTEPHNILFETRKIIINRLKKDGSPEGGKDGMDCSLLVLNHDKTQLSFASAHNPVIIIRNQELLEFRGDKMPVGKHDKDNDPFTLHTITLQKGDVIYALTDGFPDQFGGDKGKKFMIKNLKELLLQIAHLPMPEQEQKLADEFDKWKGSNEQVDDVCVIGVRV